MAETRNRRLCLLAPPEPIDELEQFIDRKEYPELFGDEPEFDFEIESEEEVGLMLIEEFEEKAESCKHKMEG